MKKTRLLVLLSVMLIPFMMIMGGCQPNLIIGTVTPEATTEAVVDHPTDVPPTEVPPTEVPPTEVPPTETPLPPAEDLVTPTEEAAVAPEDGPVVVDRSLPIESNHLFTTSGQCAVCHTTTIDASGADVSMDRQWRSSMMSNSGRDPYWQAGVRNEVLMNPDYAEFIQDKCSTCHMPMARYTQYAAGNPGLMFGEEGYASEGHDLHVFANDGISCTSCHQFDGDALGTEDSHSGHYVIDTTTPQGERLSYGPFEVSDTNKIVMQGSSGFIPTQVDFMGESEVCGVCHTLYTPTLNFESEIVGEFAEQMVYPEWLNSDYSNTDTCQDCHMPAAEGAVPLSITSPADLREPYMQHTFIGANAYMPAIIRDNADELGATAEDEHYESTIQLAIDQLQNNTATLSIEHAALADGVLTAEVVIDNLVGHKYPTSYPARRTWLHVTVTDAADNIVFESGAFNANGSIDGNDNDADGLLFEPHYTEITTPDQVQIYEAIMVNVAGEPTTTLLMGAGYIKDNRLLPNGFDKEGAHVDYQVWGNAETDDDFIGGGDTVHYTIDVSNAEGPLTITVEMLYQSIAYRWAHNLEQHDSFETNRFLDYYNAMPSPAVPVTAVSTEIE